MQEAACCLLLVGHRHAGDLGAVCILISDVTGGWCERLQKSAALHAPIPHLSQRLVPCGQPAVLRVRTSREPGQGIARSYRYSQFVKGQVSDVGEVQNPIPQSLLELQVAGCSPEGVTLTHTWLALLSLGKSLSGSLVSRGLQRPPCCVPQS